MGVPLRGGARAGPPAVRARSQAGHDFRRHGRDRVELMGGLGGASCGPEVGVVCGISGVMGWTSARGEAGTSDGAGSADSQVAGSWGRIRADSVSCISASVPSAEWLGSDGGSARPGRHWAVGLAAA